MSTTEEVIRAAAFRTTPNTWRDVFKAAKDKQIFVRNLDVPLFHALFLRILASLTGSDVEYAAWRGLDTGWCTTNYNEYNLVVSRQFDPSWAPFYDELVRRCKNAYDDPNAWFYYRLNEFRRDPVSGAPLWHTELDSDTYSVVVVLMGVLDMVHASVLPIPILQRVRSFLPALKRPTLKTIHVISHAAGKKAATT